MGMVTNSFLNLDASLCPLVRGLINFSIEMLFPCPLHIVFMWTIFAKDCILTGNRQACTRISRLFVWLFGCQHAENGLIHRKLDVDYPLAITSIGKPFFKPDQTRKEEHLVHPVFCIVDTGSCSEFALISNVDFCRSNFFWK